MEGLCVVETSQHPATIWCRNPKEEHNFIKNHGENLQTFMVNSRICSSSFIWSSCILQINFIHVTIKIEIWIQSLWKRPRGILLGSHKGLMAAILSLLTLALRISCGYDCSRRCQKYRAVCVTRCDVIRLCAPVDSNNVRCAIRFGWKLSLGLITTACIRLGNDSRPICRQLVNLTRYSWTASFPGHFSPGERHKCLLTWELDESVDHLERCFEETDILPSALFEHRSFSRPADDLFTMLWSVNFISTEAAFPERFYLLGFRFFFWRRLC